ncbi:DUF58 domain-containing protein [Maribacter sp. 2307ULW6-5]|uniref:DUF58 domain-containing protein n=1 Tax=Maribacter sp. 2307ULW6-5 TaxID=3386275 RepID=UPI0039BCC1B9
MVNTVAGLSLIAKVVVTGYLSGATKSIRVGPGMEFSQYRGYEPGDDLRLLDWKMVARSGRHYIKQSDRESQLNVTFVLDTSNSMAHTENGLSKIDHARTLIAVLAYLAQKQGDTVQLYALNEEEFKSLRTKPGKTAFQRLLLQLLQLDVNAKWPDSATAAKKMQAKGGAELVFFITDLYEREQELTTFAKGLKSPRNEVMILQLMGKSEMEFDHSANITFQDLETGDKVKVNAKEARKAYLEQMERATERNKMEFLGQGIGYKRFRMDEDLATVLPLFLKVRNKLR